MKTARNCLVILCLLGFGAPRLEAGVFIGGRFTAAGRASEVTMRLEGDRARIEAGRAGPGATVIFRGDRNLVWLVEDEAKTVTEIGRADIVRVVAMLKSLEDQLKSLPPEQRALAEAMISEGLPFRKQAKPVFSRVSGGEKIGAWTTDCYEGRAGGAKVAAAWVADWTQLGVAPAELKAMNALADFFGDIGLLPDFHAEGLKSLGFEGFPVRMVGYDQGRETDRLEIGVVERREFAPALFEVPAGYERKPLELPGF